MNNEENKPGASKGSFAIIGFALGVLTVILIVFALRGC